MVVNRIITDVDDGSAIEDDHKFTRWKDGDPEPYETAWARIRAAAQAGRLGPPTWNNTTRMLSFPVVGGSPVEIEIPGGTVDISGKLNVNLQNVDTTLSAIEKNFFRVYTDTLDNRAAGLATGLSAAEQAAIRGKISASVAALVLSDENSTANITLSANQVIHFTNTGNTYLVVNDIADIQIDQIRNDLTNIRQIHLPHVSAAEINAGTEIDARAMGPADIVGIINAHKPTIHYAELMGEPFIYVPPGDALPAPTAANQTFLLVAGTAQGRIIYHQQIEHGSALSVTYRDFNSTDLSSGNYRGEVNYPQNLPANASAGDVYYVRNDENLRIYNDVADAWGYEAWGAGEYLGAYESEARADEAVAAHYPSGGTGTPVGKHIGIGADRFSIELMTITAYTPAAPETRTWKPVFSGGGGGGGNGITEAEAESLIATHNVAADAHMDIRDSIPAERTLAQLQAAVAAMFADIAGLTYDNGLFSGSLNTGAEYGLYYPQRVNVAGNNRWLFRKLGTVRQHGFDVSDVGAWLTYHDDDTTPQNSTQTADAYVIPDDYIELYQALGGGGGVSDYDDLTNKPITRVASRNDLPVATADNLGERYMTIDDGAFYRCEKYTVHGTDRSVTWEAYPTSATGFQGNGSVDDVPENPVAADEGKWWMIRDFVRMGIAPFVQIDSELRDHSLQHVPDAGVTYLGIFNDESSASDSVTANGEAAIYQTSSQYNLHRVSAFTAGTPDHESYHWVPTDYDFQESGGGGLTEAQVLALFETWAALGGGNVPVTRGGTGAGTASVARTNLGLGTAATRDTGTINGRVPLIGSNGLVPQVLANNDPTTVSGDFQLLQYDDDTVEAAVWVNAIHKTLLANNTPTTGRFLRATAGANAEWATPPGEANVQSDWSESDSASDAFIRNKPTIPTPGITQAQGDTRYLQKDTDGTTTVQTIADPIVVDVEGNQEAFKIQAHDVTSSAIFKIETPSAGSQKAFQANRQGQNLAFLEFGGAVGGSGKGGFAVGPGTGGRDTILYRDAANMWRTPDGMHVGELRVDSGGRANSRSQLGLGTALLSFALASDDEGIEFTRADGNTEELTRAQLRTAAGITGGSARTQLFSGNISVTSNTTLYRVSDTMTIDAGQLLEITLDTSAGAYAFAAQMFHADTLRSLTSLGTGAATVAISGLSGDKGSYVMTMPIGGQVLSTNVLDYIVEALFLARDDSYNLYVGFSNTSGYDPMPLIVSKIG